MDVFSRMIENIRRAFDPKRPPYDGEPGDFRIPPRGERAIVPPFITSSQQAEAVISLPFATICLTPNYNLESPGVVITIAEILDQRTRMVNVSRCEMSARDAARLARAMSCAADWANQAEEK